MNVSIMYRQKIDFSSCVNSTMQFPDYTVLLKGNVANARNFFAIYERVSSVTSAF